MRSGEVGRVSFFSYGNKAQQLTLVLRLVVWVFVGMFFLFCGKCLVSL